MNRQTVAKLLLAFLGVIWLFVVTLNYYVVHKPFTLENALAILNALGDVLVAAALFALAAGIGRRLTRALNFVSPLEALVFQTGLGLGIISFATLALGLLGLLYPMFFWAVLLLALLVTRGDLAAHWRAVRSIRLVIASRFEQALAVFIVLALALAFLSALTPPIAWDAQAYHLVEGKIAIAQGRIAAPPDIPYFSFPSLVEMIYLAAMILKGDIVTQAIHFGFLLLTLGAVFAFARRYFNARVAWLACASLVAVPSLLLISTWAYVDVALVFFAFGSLFALLIGFDSENWRWFALAGAMAGLALGVKYTSVIVPIALAALMLLRREARVSRWTAMIGFCALFASPWYVRNLALVGNPVYPFVFGGPFWDVFRTNWFGRFGTGLLNTPLRLLIAPWNATVYGVEGKVGYQATIGPILLMLLPLAVMSVPLVRAHEETRKTVISLAVFSIILFSFWLAGIAGSELLIQTRLLFPAFPALALIAAYGFDRLDSLDVPQFSLQRFAALVILVVLAATALSYALDFAADNPVGYLVGFESRDHWLSRHLGGYYAVAQFINQRLPTNAKILFLWEPRSYYVDRSVQPDTIVDNSPHLHWLYPSADALASALRQQGYTYILVNRSGLENLVETGQHPVAEDELRSLDDLQARYLRQVYPETSEEIATFDGKPVVTDAQSVPYVLYELIGATP